MTRHCASTLTTPIRGQRGALDRLAEVITDQYPDGPPVVLDMFSGRGIIPLEAARVGALAVGVDLSPVATLGGRLLADYTFRDWSGEPSLPFKSDGLAEQAAGDLKMAGEPRLLTDVRLVLAEVGRRLARSDAAVLPA